MMKFSSEETHKKRIQHPKRLIIIVLGALIVLAGAVYGVLSYQEWAQLKDRSEAASTALKEPIDETLGAEAPESTPVKNIDTIISDFEKNYGENPCAISGLYEWQLIIPALAERQAACQEHFKNNLTVIETLKPLSAFLKDQATAATLITETIDATKTPTDYAAASDQWKKLTDLANLPDDAFAPISVEISSKAAAIAATYTALAASLKNEDKAAFDTAVEQLTTSYDALKDISTPVIAKRDALTKAFIEAYEAL